MRLSPKSVGNCVGNPSSSGALVVVVDRLVLRELGGSDGGL
eukprot:COSAG02_NODE_19546_length_876_cov_4.162051_1_plen_40_part_01